MKKLHNIIILITCIILCACSKSSATIYCENISFANEYAQNGITMYVGQTYTIPSDAIVMLLFSANVDYEIESDNTGIVSIHGKILTANAEGVAHITAKALQNKETYVASDTIMVNVLPAPIFV